MTKSRSSVALRRALPLLLVAAAVALGVTMRVRYLRQEMMSRWHGALEGGALTTQATVDEWFADRIADAEALAASIAVHAAFPHSGDASPPFSTVLAPVVRRGKFTSAWVLDSVGRIVSRTSDDSLSAAERDAVVQALGSGHPTHSAVVPLGPHAATFAIAAPVHLATAGGSARL